VDGAVADVAGQHHKQPHGQDGAQVQVHGC
jgi:hypothetical protein